MTLPGATVEIVDAPPPAASTADTATAFVVGLADRGVATGQLKPSDVIRSLAELVERHGARQSYNGPEFDAAEAFFVEGGQRLFWGRVVGPGASRSSAGVPVTGANFSASAKGPGSYGDALTVEIASGVITVRESGVIVEVSPELASVAEAQAWATNTSAWIDIEPIASGALTDSVAVALTGGTDDRTSISDAERQAALDRLGKDLGPGQVAMPGDSRTEAHTMLAQHARATNRFAYGDMPDTASEPTITAAALAVRALGRDVSRHIQLLEPWLIAPGTATGTTRTIPPSAVMLGMVARSDTAGNPNRAVAGANGVSRFAIDVKRGRSDAEREALADAGVTVFLVDGGQVQAYDDVTPVDPDTDPEWLGAANNRMVMRLVADALTIAKAHMFGETGQVDIAAFEGDLKGMLAGWSAPPRRALQAFRVDTGPSVNTPETIAARQLRAAIALQLVGSARQVVVQITNTPPGAAV